MSKPLIHDKEAEDNTSFVLVASCGLCRFDYSRCDDRTMRFRDYFLGKVARNDRLDLIL